MRNQPKKSVVPNGNNLQNAPPEHRADREIVMAAVEINSGYKSLNYASKELRADRTIVLAAVKEDYGQLEFASLELKDDKEVVVTAMSNDDRFCGGLCSHYASKRIQNDSEVKILGKRLEELRLVYWKDYDRDENNPVRDQAEIDKLVKSFSFE